MRTVLLTRVRAAVTACTLIAGLASPAVAHAASASRTAASSSAMLAASTADRVPHYNHVAVIMFTNCVVRSTLEDSRAPD